MADETEITATSEEESEEYSIRDRLNDVNTAIQAVLLGGQSYKIGSRHLSRADLALLRSMRDDLEAQLVADEDPHLFRNTYVAFFEGR